MAPGPDPLLDSLFRPTTLTASQTSAAPVRAAGTHTRAGNAMLRTRTALLAGARTSVIASGTKITMSQVAAAAGVAKATLYNHFRTREAVLNALLEDEVGSCLAQLPGRPLGEALADAATTISEHPVLRALDALEPATLATLSRVDPAAAQWRRVRDGVQELLATHDRDGTDTVLRWLSSFATSPATPAAIAADLDILLAGLPAGRGRLRPTARTA